MIKEWTFRVKDCYFYTFLDASASPPLYIGVPRLHVILIRTIRVDILIRVRTSVSRYLGY